MGEHKTVNEVAVSVQVDTSKLDEAITKTRQLMQMLERADTLAYRVRKNMDEINSKDKFKCPFCSEVLNITFEATAHDKIKQEGYCKRCDLTAEIVYPPLFDHR